MSTVTIQHVPQLSVRNRMTSTRADHDHNVFVREESRHSVVQTTVKLMVVLRFHDGLRKSRISTTVCPQAPVAFRFIERSAVDHPY